jgi:hypothetical protein
MMGIFLIAAAAVAQDNDRVVATIVPDDDMIAATVTPDERGDIAAEEVVLDDNAIVAKVVALQKHVAIGSVRIKVAVANRKANTKVKTITVATEQDQDAPFVGTLRLTVEMRDGTNMWYGQEQLAQEKWTKITAKGEDTGKIDYVGEDIWSFKIPFGKGTEIVRPDVRAYATEYGFVVSNKVAGNKFCVVAAKCREVAGGDEIMARNQNSKNVLKIRSSGRALKEGEGEDKESGDDGDDGGGD